MRNHKLTLLAVAVAVTLGLTACGSDTADNNDAEPREEIRVALAEVTSNLDLATWSAPASYIHLAGTVGYLISHPYKPFPYPELYDGTAEVFDADTYDPDIATEWELSEDGLSLTMQLRDDAVSPYGNTLTAEDIVWTAQRNVALSTVGNFGMTVANIDKTNPVTAEGPNTVVWHLTKPSPLLLKVMAWSWFAPIDSVEAKKHATADDPWATEWLKENTAWFGPYTVTQFTPGQSATLELNPNYYGDTPAVHRITFQSVPDAGNRQQLVQRGEIDFVPDIPRSQLASLEDDPAVQVQLQPGTRFSYLQYRAGIAPLDDVRVRQAISYAIPYDTIISDVYHGTTLPAKTPGTWLPGAHPELSPYELDLDKARQLMEQAGYESGFTIGLSYSVANPGPENEQAAVLIADSLKEIGITVNLQKSSSEAAFITSYNAGEFEMALAGLAPGAPDPGYAVTLLGNSVGFQNFAKFSNAEFDALSNEMNSEMDTTRRAALIEETTALYVELVPATPIANPLIAMVTSADLHGVKLGTWGFPYWKYVTLAE